MHNAQKIFQLKMQNSTRSKRKQTLKSKQTNTGASKWTFVCVQATVVTLYNMTQICHRTCHATSHSPQRVLATFQFNLI